MSLTALDNFSRFMAELFDERDFIAVPTGGLAFFGRSEANGVTGFSPDAEILDQEIIRGNEKSATLVARGTVSRLLGPNQRNANDVNSTSVARKYPLSIESGDITEAQLKKRLPGELPHSPLTQEERMRALAARTIKENNKRQVRLLERLAWEVITTGKQSAILGEAVPTYDFYRNSENTISVGVAWDQALAVIMANIDQGCDVYRKNGKIPPDMGIMGGDAMNAFLNDDLVKELADNRRIELIQISETFPVPERFAKFIEGGMEARGRLRTPKGRVLWLFTYDEIYNNDAGDAVNYMPLDKMIISSSRAKYDRYFGPAEFLPISQMKSAFFMERFGMDLISMPGLADVKAGTGVITPEMFIHNAYEDTRGTRISVESHMAPLLIPTMTDTFVVLEDLITP